MYSSLLRRPNPNTTTSPTVLLSSLTFLRPMGGGPRTFPGGLNKWQWKRMHEKKAKEKEKRLLDQEKQLYQARIRSQIRAKLAPQHQPGTTNRQPDPNYAPMSPDEQIKALADRFMKPGAEDLWNEADGPIKSASAQAPQPAGRTSRMPIDIRRLISQSEGSSSTDLMVSSKQKRYYSVCRLSLNGSRFGFGRNDDSESRLGDGGLISRASGMNSRCSDNGLGDRGLISRFVGMNFGSGDNRLRDRGLIVRSIGMSFCLRELVSNWDRSRDSTHLNGGLESRCYSAFARRGGKGSRFNFRRDESSEDEGSDDEFGDGEGGERRDRDSPGRLLSSAGLGKYDVKKTRRVPLTILEDEEDLSERVEAIRKEFHLRNSVNNRMDGSDGDSILSEKRFDECNVSPLTVKALSEAGYVQMTRVQEATLSVCLDGKDALVKAKTGTGKSAAFLLPAIETVLKASTSNTVKGVPPVDVLILCPTRELASQIAAETNVMLRYHDGFGVQTLVGGTRFKVDQKRLESDPCQIIVATPGRLLDHIENKSGFSVRLMGLKMLILDEADHLLDLGFRKDMEKIVDCLPRQRQSLLFSATVPKEVRRISQLVLKREHAYIDTVGLGCVETPAKIKQFILVTSHELHFQVVHHLLNEHISRTHDYKVVVFCTTAVVTSLMFLVLRDMKLNVREIHSRKPQLYRSRISDEFKASKRLILITSDVSARGMNYPDVTLVIQVGIPSDRENYIHRLGRTGREGKEGEGILLLAPWEEYFLQELKDLPVDNYPAPQLDPDVKIKIEDSMAKIDTSFKEAAYHAWLGYYNSIREIGRDKTTLVELANQFCHSIGLEKTPALYRKTALKMGLKDIPGIRIRK